MVSVRSVKAGGLMGLMGSTRLEVIAQVPAPGRVEPAPVAQNDEAADWRTPPPGPASANADSPASAPAPAVARAARGPASVYGAATPPVGLANASDYSPSGPAAATAAAARRQPSAPRLEGLLRRSGLSEQLIARLQADGNWAGADADQPLHQGLLQVADQIRQMAADVPIRKLATRTAFLGMPGVGRTTALCKWLSAEVFTRGRRGCVASVEFDRQLGAEDLAVFAELLGLEFCRQVPASGPGGGDFCYIDVPPLSLTRIEENARLHRFLDEQRIPGRVLVVSALHDSALLRRTCTIGVELGCTHLIFTQLDELPQWGKLWDFLIESPLVPMLLTQGPSLSGECETEVVEAVVRRTFPWN